MLFSCCCPTKKPKKPQTAVVKNKTKPKSSSATQPLLTPDVSVTEDERMSDFTEPRPSVDVARSSVSSSDETVSFLDENSASRHRYEIMGMEKREPEYEEEVRKAEEVLTAVVEEVLTAVVEEVLTAVVEEEVQTFAEEEVPAVVEEVLSAVIEEVPVVEEEVPVVVEEVPAVVIEEVSAVVEEVPAVEEEVPAVEEEVLAAVEEEEEKVVLEIKIPEDF